MKDVSICKLCDKEFKQSQGRKRSRCGSCNTLIRRYRTKEAAIKYLGGKCERCGYVGPQASFDFHHRDTETKKTAIASITNKRWEEVVKELDKCELLCANCHRIEHSSRLNDRLIKEANDYNGRLLNIGS